MKRTTVWRLVIASGLISLCLIGWAVIEAVKWVAGLASCI